MLKKSKLLSTIAILSLVGIPGCQTGSNISKMDRERDMQFQDYRDALAPRDLVFEDEPQDMDIPELSSYVTDHSDQLESMPLVNVSANQDIPLRQVLSELARNAGYDLEFDPRIKGAIIMTATNKPVDVVVGRIAHMAGLRYEIVDRTLRVELDTPYTDTYHVEFLNMTRKNKSDISADVSVVTGEGADTGSSYEVKNESETDFWGEIEENVKQILESNASPNLMRTNNDPSINVTAPNTNISTVSEDDLLDGDMDSDSRSRQETASRNGPAARLKVDSLPTTNMDVDTNAIDYEPKFSINKQAGMISVYANERAQKKVESYIRDVLKVVSAQVLIEAKVLEVSLSDEYSTGIDWGVMDLGSNFSFDVNPLTAVGAATGQTPGINFSISGNDINVFANALNKFGTVKALSSPRLTVLNNQSAVLNVATNSVYFELDAETEQGLNGAGDRTTVDSKVRTVPEGVIVYVQPFANIDTKEITMSVRPTITRIVRQVTDPGIELILQLSGAGNANITAAVPEVNVQEIDSIVKMRSGDVMVMGGLIQDRTNSEVSGPPVLSEIPLFNKLFTQQSDKITKTELVVFIRAKLIEPSQTMHQTDKDLYKLFSSDRRPVKM